MLQFDHQPNHDKPFYINIKKSDIPIKINNDNYIFKEEEENKNIKWHENLKNQKPDFVSKTTVEPRINININDITNDNKINLKNNNKRNKNKNYERKPSIANISKGNMKITNGEDFNINSVDIPLQYALFNSMNPEKNKKRK